MKILKIVLADILYIATMLLILSIAGAGLASSSSQLADFAPHAAAVHAGDTGKHLDEGLKIMKTFIIGFLGTMLLCLVLFAAAGSIIKRYIYSLHASVPFRKGILQFAAVNTLWIAFWIILSSVAIFTIKTSIVPVALLSFSIVYLISTPILRSAIIRHDNLKSMYKSLISSYKKLPKIIIIMLVSAVASVIGLLAASVLETYKAAIVLMIIFIIIQYITRARLVEVFG